MNGIMMSKVYSIAALIFLLLFLISCTMTSRNDERSGTMGKKLYYNGDIITMESELYAEAVLVSDGIIEKVGNFGYTILRIPKKRRRVP